MRNRKTYYDIVKALGIISIVIGHCHPDIRVVRFVYSYHLAIFFFISGVQFNIKKYCNEPFLLMQKRVQTMWPGFFGYMTFFTVIHNAALNMGLIVNESNYTKFDLLNRTLNNFLFLGAETLGGAMWFVPVLLGALLFFAAIVYFSHLYCKKHWIISTIVCSCAVGAIGIYCNLLGKSMTLHLHTTFILMPFLLTGALLSYFQVDFNKVFRLAPALACLMFTCWITIKQGILINLAAEQIGSALLFYPLSICGIYAMCTAAKYLDKIKYLSSALSFVGRYSFDIMSLHFIIFKVVDLCYAQIIGAESYSRFPYAFFELWPVYIIVSIALAPWIRVGLTKLFSVSKELVSKYYGEET